MAILYINNPHTVSGQFLKKELPAMCFIDHQLTIIFTLSVYVVPTELVSLQR